MNRRDMITSTLAAAAAAVVTTTTPRSLTAAAAAAGAASTGPSGPELYELRLYRLRRGPMQKRADDYFRDALIPALRRHGCGPVGAFNVVVGPGNPTVYVLIPHPSAEAFAALPAKLDADAEYRRAAEPFLAAPATDPPYVAIESSLLRAVGQMPRIEVPAGAAEKAPRIFELRTYRSHGERAAAKKVEMFEAGGELAIFRRVGLQPVFFATGLTGPDLPSLTYMLTFPDLATRERNWNAFRVDPEWKKLSATPGYTDPEIVSSISSVILAPAAYSQV